MENNGNDSKQQKRQTRQEIESLREQALVTKTKELARPSPDSVTHTDSNEQEVSARRTEIQRLKAQQTVEKVRQKFQRAHALSVSSNTQNSHTQEQRMILPSDQSNMWNLIAEKLNDIQENLTQGQAAIEDRRFFQFLTDNSKRFLESLSSIIEDYGNPIKTHQNSDKFSMDDIFETREQFQEGRPRRVDHQNATLSSSTRELIESAHHFKSDEAEPIHDDIYGSTQDRIAPRIHEKASEALYKFVEKHRQRIAEDHSLLSYQHDDATKIDGENPMNSKQRSENQHQSSQKMPVQNTAVPTPPTSKGAKTFSRILTTQQLMHSALLELKQQEKQLHAICQQYLDAKSQNNPELKQQLEEKIGFQLTEMNLLTQKIQGYVKKIEASNEQSRSRAARDQQPAIIHKALFDARTQQLYMEPEHRKKVP